MGGAGWGRCLDTELVGAHCCGAPREAFGGQCDDPCCAHFLLQVAALGPRLAGGSTLWLCLLRAMFLLLPLPSPSPSPSPSPPAARILRIPRAPPAARAWQVRKRAFPIIRFGALISSKFVVRDEPVPAQPRWAGEVCSPLRCDLSCICELGRRPRVNASVSPPSWFPVTFFLLLQHLTRSGLAFPPCPQGAAWLASLGGKWNSSVCSAFAAWSAVAGGCCPGIVYLRSERVAFPLSHHPDFL